MPKTIPRNSTIAALKPSIPTCQLALMSGKNALWCSQANTKGDPFAAIAGFGVTSLGGQLPLA